MATKYIQRKRLQNAASTSDEAERLTHLRSFAQELTAEIYEVSPENGEGMLSTLIAELAMSAADRRRKIERCKHQRECVAAAQARGVQFGRRTKPLPDNFDEYRQAWLDGEMSLRAAAESCGMTSSTFQRAVLRQEQAAVHAG